MVTHILELQRENGHLCGMRIVLLLALVACGPHGPCADRQGSYVVSFSERDGTCGPQNDGVVNIQPNGAPSPCSGTSLVTTDNCSVDFDAVCPFNAGQTVESQGQVTWSTDGANGSGTIQLTLRDSSSNILCEGTYNVHYQRQ